MGETATVDEHSGLLALRQKVDELEARLEWFRKQVFDQKSEHAKPMDVNQLSLFAQQVEQAQAALSAAEQETHVKAYVRKKNKKLNENLGHEVETIEKTIDITDEQRKCAPSWKLVSIGRREMRTSATYVPAKVVKIIYYVRTYKKVQIDGEEDPEFLQAKLPNAAFRAASPRSRFLPR